MARTTSSRPLLSGLAILGATGLFALGAASAASAATVIDGPVDLGSATSYGVLAGSTITNTGPTVVRGDVGLSPGTSVTGFTEGPGSIVGGTLHVTDATAALAQGDLTTAYNAAAGLTPQESGITELNGRSLSPGVYSGGALNLADTGALAFAGSAESVWVIQAASTLTIGAATTMTFSGGASACNVFWQVGSSATIGSGAQFRGTVMADESITATTGATVIGRLLARDGAVTLDTNTLTVPAACPTVGTPSESVPPTITSDNPPDGIVGTPYSHTITSDGNPDGRYTIIGGDLPNGLVLDEGTGVISGTPTTPGPSTVTIIVSNGDEPDDEVTYTITIEPQPTVPPGPGVPPGGTVPPGGGTPNDGTPRGELAATGFSESTAGMTGGIALLLGVAFLGFARLRRRSTLDS